MGYYYISKWREQVPAIEGSAGRIIMPSGLQVITLERRHMQDVRAGQGSIFDGLEDGYLWTNERGLMLDPQLYLSGLAAETCSDACSYLVGYPWFKCKKLDPYDSSRLSQAAYRQQIKAKIASLWEGLPDDDEIRSATDAAIQYQHAIGCAAIILPSPLTTDSGTSYDLELRWLDEGIAAASARGVRVPVLATVALSDICTFSADPKSNRLLDTLLDHVTAREVDGVYLVIEQRVDQSYYISSKHTLCTIKRLVSEFADAGLKHIVVSWAGLAGYASLAVGATGWASGWYRKERRLKLDDHRDDSGGIASPAYYAHRLCGEIHPEDLDRLAKADLLDLVEEKSQWAQDLFRAIRSGVKTANVDAWTQETARAHFNATVIRETTELTRLSQADRSKHVASWLKDAAATAKKISELGRLHDRTTVTHQSTWAKAFEA